MQFIKITSMELKDFISGKYISQYGYSSFSPEPVNHEWLISDAIVNRLLNDASHKLGELNAFSTLIPDVDFFIRMHITKEATQSSKIEGTQTSIEEAIQTEEFINPDKRDDWHEVHNYIEAMNFAIGQLDKLPLSTRLIKLTHEILLQGVRGRYKSPGEFRKSQNWIGGTKLLNAAYIPPHPDDVPERMSDLEKFLNNEDLHVSPLIRIGIAHYQFESIHPFLDGNGRSGRLLITLYLVSNNILSKPSLYLSDFFERNRSLYYDNLTIVRTQNNLTQWLKFFLAGVLETAENSIAIFNSIIKLRKEVEQAIIKTLGRRVPPALELMRHLYSKPIVDAPEVAKVLKVNISTAHRMIQEFETLGILKEKTGFKRNRIFVFEEYLDLFKK